MSEKTARKYRDHDGQPSQQTSDRTYRTRSDPFADVWDKVQHRLELEPRLKAKTLFEWLQQTHEGLFPDSTRRTFERRVNQWRSLHGPGKTVFFDQEHHPGRLAASDFTVCNELGVKIAGRRFDHTFFHCVLTYSNVETCRCVFPNRLKRSVPPPGAVCSSYRSEAAATCQNNNRAWAALEKFRKRSGILEAYRNGIAAIRGLPPFEITRVDEN